MIDPAMAGENYEVVPDAKKAEANDRLVRIKETVKRCVFNMSDHTMRLRASMGLATTAMSIYSKQMGKMRIPHENAQAGDMLR